MDLELDINETVGPPTDYATIKDWRRTVEVEVASALQDAGLANYYSDVLLHLPGRVAMMRCGAWRNDRDGVFAVETFHGSMSSQAERRYGRGARRARVYKCRKARLCGWTARLP